MEAHQGTGGGIRRFRQSNCSTIRTQAIVHDRIDARGVSLSGGREAVGGDECSVHVVKNVRPDLADVYEMSERGSTQLEGAHTVNLSERSQTRVPKRIRCTRSTSSNSTRLEQRLETYAEVEYG